jgi:ubiquinone/menaquinone biosynthesis C-methylase UbiE
MPDTRDEGANAQQVAYWNESAGPTWAELQEPLDRQLAPLGRRAMAELELGPGQRVLDIGCGAGETTIELSYSGAEILGVDISTTLLAVARQRPRDTNLARFLEADAQTQPFEPAHFDAVFSRFGVMFFADPAAAFANIRRAMKPAGRLAFVCWRTPAENPIMSLPMMAALAHIDTPPAPPEPGAPGPFAFADPERVKAILATAGFRDVAVTPHDEAIGSGDVETTLGLALRVGPLGALLRENPGKREAVIAAVRAAIAPHDGPDGVKLGSATWIVTARA